jgi:serine protease Do
MKNPKLLFLTIIIIMLSIILPGCMVSFSEFDGNTPAAPTEPGIAVPINPTWVPPADNTPRTVALPSFADIIEKAYPSVVAITTETVMLDFFSQQQTQKGAGSGWVLDNKDGKTYIVTNNHVVEGAEKVMIAANDGKSFEVYKADVKTDSFTDLAVMQVSGTVLKPIAVGDSVKLRVGDWVLALGNPLGQGIKSKEGTVSGLNVSLPFDNGQLSDLIETSAPINPGNSGGPLINLNGEVVGITSAKIADIGVEGLGYAISMKAAMPIISQLITKGYIARPYLGVSTRSNSPDIALFNRLGTDKGAIIINIDSSGPAATAGLELYDIITRFNEKDINTSEDLMQALYSSEIGQSVDITFVRKQATRTLTTKLTENKPK